MRTTEYWKCVSLNGGEGFNQDIVVISFEILF